MSIINDALKKAHKEFKQDTSANQAVNATVRTNISTKTTSDAKRVLVAALSLAVVIATLLGGGFLFKHIKKNARHTDNRIQKNMVKDTEIRSRLNDADNKYVNNLRTQDIVKLTGIVSYIDGKWAIINNKIFKEGDMINSGRISNITTDAVRIKKSNGEEIVLNLK